MFIWHSKGTEESGAKLAEKMGCEHGTLPAENYEGDVFCLNAKPSDKFNWTSRKFRKIFNDPRKLQQARRKEAITKLLSELAIPVRTFCMKKADGTYNFNTVKRVASGGENTAVQLPNEILETIENICERFDSPDFLALDGTYKATASLWLLEKPVFGPAMAEDEVLTELVSEFVGELIETDKDKLQKVIDEGSPEELKALVDILSRVKKTT